MSSEVPKPISGFSRLSKRGKIKWLVENFFRDPEAVMRELTSYWHHDEAEQRILDGISENTISNFLLPYGVAPNFRINDRYYVIPMVTEESSVVAAASSAAKFWMDRGGFQANVVSTIKKGQVHFIWKGDFTKLQVVFQELEVLLREEASVYTANMESRGGGVKAIRLIHQPQVSEGYYQLDVDLITCDSMGANFTNTILESFARTLTHFITTHPGWSAAERQVLIIMSILSNYTPESLVHVSVRCPVSELGSFAGDMDAGTFAHKFDLAVRIARLDPYRATTHNKGIFNGVDAVVIATGNDFRAVEACGHAYAARDGVYRSLSDCRVEDGKFHFWMDLPLSLGTVGGLTALHPIARRSLELLGHPGAEELMEIVASVGLAQNFAAVRSLVTTGIQQGHMKMHLRNILLSLKATDEEIMAAEVWFGDKTVTYQDVRRFLQDNRQRATTFVSES